MLVFRNPGLIDTTALTTMGVNAKLDESAIGQFGTGIKYAIAIVLRLGGSIRLFRGRKEYVFGLKTRQIRGKEFRLVTMNGGALGFTDHFGHGWEPWEAYRELWSNTRDEHGTVSQVETFDDVRLESGWTTFVVDCPELDAAHQTRHQIVLTTDPLVSMPGLEIHAGQSKHVFYRGIRAMNIPDGLDSLYTYNLTGEHELTEDRKLKDQWWIPNVIARAIVLCTSKPIIHDLMGGGSEKKWEEKLPWNSAKDVKPSPQFMDVAEELQGQKKLRSGPGEVFRHYRDTIPGYTSLYLVTPTEAGEELIRRARKKVVSKFGEILVPKREKMIFKSSLNLGTVQVGKADSLVLSDKLLTNENDLACALVEGTLALVGGSVVKNLCHFIVNGELLTKEVKERRQELEYDF